MSGVPIDWKSMRAKVGPYPPEAYDFVQRGLAHTAQIVHGEKDPGDNRHVSGQQLCLGLKDFAIKQYGLLARTVLNRWNIQRTDDFGRIVFGMIDQGLMRKTDEDTLEDFRGVYDFGEAFAEPEHV
ncbi:MAG: hypothetical protein IT432_01545 [Phycisphaerales bacterium]|nr:hypothetical protein [Phycisphaerales bacterium]